ncbi:MAG: FAD binding domain-containing protein [Sneathiella sp.]|nr:FAD binding domain-containing protein [Sneathiella sp.]
MGSYYRPTNMTDLQAALRSGPVHILAGGTDFYPARVGRPLIEDILDLTAVPELCGIEETAWSWRIGATTTWTDIIRADLPPLYEGLKAAAREVGGWQVQNAGTIGGNLCNASPAADGVPALLSLGAEVELLDSEKRELIDLTDFILGNRKTRLQPGQVLTAIVIPKPRAATVRSVFLKLGARKYLVISLVMVAIVLETDKDDRIIACRVAVGACSEVAMRLGALEEVLLGEKRSSELQDLVTRAHIAPLTPIDDIRASKAYRLDAALTVIRRALAQIGSLS